MTKVTVNDLCLASTITLPLFRSRIAVAVKPLPAFVYIRFICRFVNTRTTLRSDECQAVQTSILDDANMLGGWSADC